MEKNTLPRLEGVEALRAIAAFMIMIYHLVLLPDIQIPEYLNVIKSHFGKGVPLFYALSGFVLSYGYLDRLNSRPQIIRFYIRRYFRIAPLFYLMIAVWIIVTKIKWSQLTPISYHDVIINASLLFGMVPGKHESIVWAGWSIGVEFLFYIIFPIITVLITNLRASLISISITILVSSTFFTSAANFDMGSYGYMNIITHLPTFICGMMAFLLWRKTGFFQNKLVGTLLLILTISSALILIYIPSTNRFLIKITGVRLDLYIWSFIFMIFILAVCIWPNRILVNKLSTKLGRISFSLYLWHPFIIIMLVQFYKKIGEIFHSSPLNFLICCALTIPLVIVIASYSFRIIEIPGIKIGKRFSNEY